MALASRNDRCPCGSGRKYKRCCGFDRAREQALEDYVAALGEIGRLPFRSPRLVPLCDGYEAWVRAVLAGEIDGHVDEAIATLGTAESERIVAACLALFPGEWSSLAARCPSERDALAALLGGAVSAGIRDRRSTDAGELELQLELIEESDELAGDPFEALALCFDGGQLWEPAEGRDADRVLDAIPDWVSDDAYEVRWHAVLAGLSVRCATDWHRRRLALLVARIAEQLPFAGLPRASTAIGSGCVQYAAEEAFQARLAATLLGDLVGRDRFEQLRRTLAAA